MDTKALRQKILDLAIRGKLVPQDPNDEPASVLLERIRAEKERLIAEGKIKRQKKSKASSSESHYQKFTPPFTIPDNWEWIKLEVCCSIITDGDHQAPPKSKEGIPFLVISDVISGKLNFDNCRFVPITYYNSISEERKPIKNDILFTVTGSYGVPIRVNTDDKFCFQRHIGLIRPIFVTDWLYYVLQSRFCMAYCDKYATGTAQKTVGLQTLRDFYIPLPPLEEQRLIIKSVSNWLNNITQLSLASSCLTYYLKLAKSKILELAMQGKLVPQDPADEPAADMLRRINPKARIITDNPHYPQLPDNWVWISIEDLNEYKPKSINPAESPSEIFDLYSVPIFPTGHPEKVIGKEIGSTKQSVQHGDVLLCKINPHLNRVWTIEEVSDNMQIASSEWIVIRSSSTYSTYLRWLFSSPFFRKLLCSQVSGVGGSLTRAQPAVVKKYLIPIPPYNEQIRIVSKIVELLSALTEIDSNLAD